jgi:hypothetical protein
MSLRDWLLAIAPFVSFAGALLGAWLGSSLARRNDRDRLLRELRVKAAADLLTSASSALRWVDAAAQIIGRPGASLAGNRDVVDARNRAMEEAWATYHRARLLGPKAVTEAAQAYWREYDRLALLIGEPPGAIEKYAPEMRAAEERF